MRKAWPTGGGGGEGLSRQKQINFADNTYQAASLVTSQIHGKNIHGYDIYVKIN
jgi:hypothetical protein